MNNSELNELEKKAISLLKSKDFYSAILLFKEIMKNDSKNLSSRLLLGRCMVELQHKMKNEVNDINENEFMEALNLIYKINSSLLESNLVCGKTGRLSDFLPNKTWQWFTY